MSRKAEDINESIIEKTFLYYSDIPHPPPRIEYGAGSDLPLEGGGRKRFPSPSGGGKGGGGVKKRGKLFMDKFIISSYEKGCLSWGLNH